MPPTTSQRLAYRDAFRSRYNQDFQAWFERLASFLYPGGDFQAIRSTSGDGGIDGFVIGSQSVYQVFAPARIDELRDGETATKIRDDFLTAYSTLSGNLKAWTFIHNHPEGKIGKQTAAAISSLQTDYPAITFRVLNIDGLWDELARLSDDVLSTLFGDATIAPPGVPTDTLIAPQTQALIDEADSLVGRGRYDDARTLLRGLLADGSPFVRAVAQIDLAEIDLFQNVNVVAARDTLLACLRVLPATASKHRQGALALLGHAESQLGSISAAHSLFQEAAQLARDRKDRFSEAHALIGLSHVEEHLGNLSEAERLVDDAVGKCRAEYRDAGAEDPRGRQKAATNLAAALSTRAHLLTHSGRLTEALVSLEAALPLFKEVDSQDNIGRALLLKAEILLTEAKWQDGFDVLQQAGTLFQSTGNVTWECRVLRHMARVMEHAAGPVTAMACLSRAVSLLEAAKWLPRERVPYLLDLARIAWNADMSDQARARIEEAKLLADVGVADGSVADCLLAEAHLISGEKHKADRMALFSLARRDIEAALSNCEVRGRRAEFMERLGTICGYSEEPQQARTWFERALAEFEIIGDVAGVARCLGAIAGAARADHAPTEAIEALQRVVDFTKALPLYHERAIALHDLAVLMLTRHGDVLNARRHLDDARALAERHGFADVLETLHESSQLLEHAERVTRPSEMDLRTLTNQLRTWCATLPAMRDAIVPLWYFVHRTDFWRICRSTLGVKFLIPTGRLSEFEDIATALNSHGDLFIWAPVFRLRHQPRIEAMPWPEDLLIPPHLSFVGIQKKAETAGEPTEQAANEEIAATGEAIKRFLKKEPYVLVPLNTPFESHTLYAVGRHVRLSSTIVEFMLKPTAEARICLPLAQRIVWNDKSERNDTDDASLLHILLVAWENRIVPIIPRALPDARHVKALIQVSINLPVTEFRPGVDNKRTWANFLSECEASPQDALERFRAAWSSGGANTVPVTAYVLRFTAGKETVNYPALVMRM